MALNTFGWTPAEVTTDSAGNAIAGAELTVWADLERTTPIGFAYARDGSTVLPTKTVYAKGDPTTALTSAVVTSGAKGRFGFLAADTYSLLYVWDGSSDDPWPVAAHQALDSGTATHAQAVADAQAAANSAAASANLVGAPADTAIATAINGAGTQTKAALDGAYETGAAKVICVSPTGNDSRNGKTWGTAKATIAAAVTALAGAPGTILLDHGTHEVGNGLSLSGAKCSLIGRGAGMTGTTADRTVIKASTQTGPVLDLAGYVWPANFRGRVEFGKFAVVGSGVADATKVKTGIRVGTTAQPHGATYFHDIAISGTGGPALDLGSVYLCDFERITLVTPVSAQTNDVPYLRSAASNGNRFIGIGLMAPAAAESCGVSGAVQFLDNGTSESHNNTILGMWFENLNVPTGGCIVSSKSNLQSMVDFQFFDCKKITGATGTTHFRLTDSPVNNYGGNSIRGHIPGRGTGANSIDYGVDVSQSGNSIAGVKGYKGYNVRLNAGVNNTHIDFGGAESAATDPAVEDNSGTTTNATGDAYLGKLRRGNYEFASMTSASGGEGVQVQGVSAPAAGAVHLGTSGARVQSNASGDLQLGAAATRSIVFRDSAGATKVSFFVSGGNPGAAFSSPAAASYPAIRLDAAGLDFGTGKPRWRSGTGTPEGVITAPVGSLYTNDTGAAGTTLYVKETGTGNTGWVAK